MKRKRQKSKRRWKRLQQRGKWIPYEVIATLDLKGDWENDIMRAYARDRNYVLELHRDLALRFINMDLPGVAEWMNETLLHGVGAIKVTQGAIVLKRGEY